MTEHTQSIWGFVNHISFSSCFLSALQNTVITFDTLVLQLIAERCVHHLEGMYNRHNDPTSRTLMNLFQFCCLGPHWLIALDFVVVVIITSHRRPIPDTFPCVYRPLNSRCLVSIIKGPRPHHCRPVQAFHLGTIEKVRLSTANWIPPSYSRVLDQ